MGGKMGRRILRRSRPCHRNAPAGQSKGTGTGVRSGKGAQDSCRLHDHKQVGRWFGTRFRRSIQVHDSGMPSPHHNMLHTTPVAHAPPGGPHPC